MLDFILIPIFAAHLLCMNVASAGPLVACWLDWRGRNGDSLLTQTASYLVAASWKALLIGAVLGVVYGATLWTPEYRQLWSHTLRYKLHMGAAEFVFSLVLLLIAAQLAPESNGMGWRRLLRVFLSFFAGTNLLYHFPFLFSVAASMHATSPLSEPVSVAEFRRWMMRPDVLARVVHVVLASFAVTGVLLLGYASRLSKNSATTANGLRIARWGGWLGLVPSLLQMVVGLWLLAVLPPAWQQRALGDDWITTLLLGISVLATFSLLQDLAAIAFGESSLTLWRRTSLVMVMIVVCMTGTLKRIHPPQEASNTQSTAQTPLPSSTE